MTAYNSFGDDVFAARHAICEEDVHRQAFLFVFYGRVPFFACTNLVDGSGMSPDELDTDFVHTVVPDIAKPAVWDEELEGHPPRARSPHGVPPLPFTEVPIVDPNAPHPLLQFHPPLEKPDI